MTEPRKTKGTPDETDVHVGNMLRARRNQLGMSQEKLAEQVDLTFQQLQKYERGTNRIAAGRLYQFARVLEAPITYFFPDTAQQLMDGPAIASELAEARRCIQKAGRLVRQANEILGGA